MKKTVLLSIGFSIITFFTFAQSPEAFNYQAVIRDAGGSIIKNQSVSLKMSILKGSTTGYTVYAEIHQPTTNDFGLVNLKIGMGTIIKRKLFCD
jgi:hypothetical protein